MKKRYDHGAPLWMFIPTVNLKYYPKNGGNVPASRVRMFKSRYLVPGGKGEVAMKENSGKRTDRKAYNY